MRITEVFAPVNRTSLVDDAIVVLLVLMALVQKVVYPVIVTALEH